MFQDKYEEMNNTINKVRRPGDIEMIFGDPKNNKYPIGQARLVEFIRNHNSHFELWFVEFLNDEGHFYEHLLKRV